MAAPDPTFRDSEPNDPVQPCPSRRHWIEIQMLGTDGVGIADIAYSVTTPDGREVNGLTDANGLARIENLPAGSCKICWTDLDQDAWQEL